MSTAVRSAAFDAIGTTAEVFVTTPAALENARALLEAELDAANRACSRFREDSELARLNRASGRPVSVGPLLLEAIEVSLRAAALTDGDVDPTVGAALRAVGYDRDFDAIAAAPARPVPLARLAKPPSAGWRQVRVDRRHSTVQVPRGIELDLGATAKALIADRAAQRVHEAAGGGVLVNLGGDLAAAGQAPDDGWQVRVTDDHRAPFDAPGQTVTIRSGGLATSSVTVRRWQAGARFAHHIVDPATGVSAEVVWRTVSVAAGSCVDANTAATAAIVRGARAPEWLEALGVPARLVRVDGSVERTAGWPEEDG